MFQLLKQTPPTTVQEMVTSTHTCGISTPTPFLGRVITIIIHIHDNWITSTSQTKIKSEVRARTYQVYAVRCTSGHINREDRILPIIDRQNEKSYSTSKSRNRNRKTQKSKAQERERKSSIQARKQESKEGNTQENAQIFADSRLASYARGEELWYVDLSTTPTAWWPL